MENGDIEYASFDLQGGFDPRALATHFGDWLHTSEDASRYYRMLLDVGDGIRRDSPKYRNYSEEEIVEMYIRSVGHISVMDKGAPIYFKAFPYRYCASDFGGFSCGDTHLKMIYGGMWIRCMETTLRI